MICVEGTLRTGSYQDKNHQDVTHYTTDVWVESVDFAGDKSGSNNGGQAQQGYQQSAPPQQQPPAQNNNMSYSNLSDFEEILSDGDVPF